MPFWGYQLQLASGEVEKHIQSKDDIRQFLNALYGGKGPNGELGFEVEKGLVFENLPKLGRTRLLDERTLDYYAEQYAKGIHSTCERIQHSRNHRLANGKTKVCWYRTREVNVQEELQYANFQSLVFSSKELRLTGSRLQNKTINVPLLFIQAMKDAALPPALSEGMERFCPKMERRAVAASHWALWEASEEVNGYIEEWLEKMEKPPINL